VYPAVRNDAPAQGGLTIAEGMWFFFPKAGEAGAVSMPAGLTTLGQMIFTAIQNYGVVVTDTTAGNGLGLGGESTVTSSTDPITSAAGGNVGNVLTDFTKIPWGSMKQINPGSINWLAGSS
jgi:hypothetical protein